MQKIEALPEATGEQLKQHNDVCSICFQSMNTARITKCGHYFHGCCLRKWLYVKDACPLCHQSISDKEDSQSLDPTDINDIIDNDDFIDNLSSDQNGSDDDSEEDSSDDSSDSDIMGL